MPIPPADARLLPFPSNSVDEVFVTNPFNESLRLSGHQLMDEFKTAVYAETARVLKPQGNLIISFAGNNRYARVLAANGELLPELEQFPKRLSY